MSNDPSPKAVRVLLVDDEPLLRTALGRLLKLARIDVLSAGNGAEALGVLQHEHVDLVLSDVRMPVLDGPGLMRALAASPQAPPLVFITGYGDLSEQELLTLGAKAVLGKPVGMGQLVAAVTTWATPRHASARGHRAGDAPTTATLRQLHHDSVGDG
jgi:CheY-like chemotaxis protein